MIANGIHPDWVSRFIDRMGFAAIAATTANRAVSQTDLETDVSAAMADFVVSLLTEAQRSVKL